MKMNKTKINPVRFLLLMLEGALVGCGAILPGVSGGALCAAFGIYEPIMDFLSNPFRGFRRHMRTLLPVILGGGIGFIGLSWLVKLLLAASPFIALMLFTGLICGTVPDMAKKAVREKPEHGWIGFILALALSFFLFTLLDNTMTGSISPNFGWYVFCGVVWGFSMVIPGLSSSSILIFMGLYEGMTDGISRLDFKVLIPLGIGFIATLLLTARGVNYLFRRWNSTLTKIILGFVISSVLVIFPLPDAFDWKVAVGLLTFAAGFTVAMWMGYMERRMEKVSNASDAAPCAEEKVQSLPADTPSQDER